MGSFENKVIVITGGAGGIGKCIAEEFQAAGAKVCVIDTAPGAHFVGDIADRETLEAFASQVIEQYGHVDVLVNNAPPGFVGIDDCSYEEFQRALAVGVTAPFYLSKLFAPYFSQGASIINISSSRDRMSQPQSESYTAAKGGISALTTFAIVITGILGNLSGSAFCKLMKLTDPVAQGVGFGTASHVIGTSRAMEVDPLTGAVSSLSLAVAGILTAILFPFLLMLL